MASDQQCDLDQPQTSPKESLIADLIAAASFGRTHDQRIYAWLVEQARAGEPTPSFGTRPNYSEIGRRLGISQAAARGHSEVIEQWHPQFVAAFSDATELPPAGNFASLDEEVLEALQNAVAVAKGDEKRILTWLLGWVSDGQTVPLHGRQPNLQMIGRISGLPQRTLNTHRDLLLQWSERVPSRPDRRRNLRDSLPGALERGSDIPTDKLVAAMQADLAREKDQDCRTLLEYLINLAQGERSLPRTRGGPHLAHMRRHCGIEKTRETDDIFDRWLGFFKLDDQITRQGFDGSTQRARIAHVEVEKFIARLRAANRTPLRRNWKPPLRPSMTWIARELNLARSAVAAPNSHKLIMAYWEEAGPGEPFEGIPEAEAAALNARRGELIAYARQCAERGEALPAGNGRVKLDYDAFVRRANLPGMDIRGDSYFLKQLNALKPTYETMAFKGGIPTTYAQLFDGLQRERCRTVAASSIAVTKSKIKAALQVYYTWLGKSDIDSIGADFDEPQFSVEVESIRKAGICGKQPANWQAEIRRAKAYMDDARQSDMLGGEFDVVLNSAIRRSDFAMTDLIAGLDLSYALLNAWKHGVSRPTKDALPVVGEIEKRLDLEEGRLTRLIDSRATGIRTSRSTVTFPPRVREFLPDNWARLPSEELATMVEWIDLNLVHVNTLYGKTMRAVSQGSWNRRRLAADAEQVIPSDRPLPEPIGALLDKELIGAARGLPSSLVKELAALQRHMTGPYSSIYARRPGSRWEIESTAPMKINMLVGFFRWQMLPESGNGLGRNPNDLTLADLVHPPLLFAYIDYKAELLSKVEHDGRKRGKLLTGSESDLVRTVKSLVSKEFGFVSQQPAIAAKIKADPRVMPDGSFVSLSGHVFRAEENATVDREEEQELSESRDEEASAIEQVMPERLIGLDEVAWEKACRRAELIYSGAHSDIDAQAEMIRDPMEPIQAILTQPTPMAVLLRQIALAAKRGPLTNKERDHHLHQRDLLMMRLFALTTLRSKNLRQLTVDGPHPKMRFDEDKQQWLIEIPWREFKNYRSAVLFGRRRKRQPYRKYLPDTHGLYALIESYLQVSRPFFAKNTKKVGGLDPELFTSSTGKKLGGDEIWRCVNRFSSRYVAHNPFRGEGIPLCGPFGPHAFRDIRATDILLNPRTNNPYFEAAMALQTSPGMIQNHYGFVKIEQRTELDDLTFLKSEELAYRGLDD